MTTKKKNLAAKLSGLATLESELNEKAPEEKAVDPTWRFQPVGANLVVRPTPEGERKVGSLVIPDTAKERPSMGDVVAVSSDIEEAGELSVGDRVVYGKYSGHELTIGEQAYIILKFQDILTILHET